MRVLTSSLVVLASLAAWGCGDETAETSTTSSSSSAASTGSGGSGGGQGGAGGASNTTAYVYVATDADKVLVMRLDRGTGALVPIGESEAGQSPSFLTTDPGRRFLFAADEGSNEISSWQIDPATGELSFRSRVPSLGGGPAYVSVDPSGSYLLAANYGENTVASIPIKDDGTLNEGDAVAFATCDKPHSIRISPDLDLAYIPCLGSDRVALLDFETSTGTLSDPAVASDFSLAAGSGPRHMEFHPTLPYAYVINETADTITVAERTPAGPLFEVNTVSTLPSGADGSTNFCADVHISADGNFLYASNRGHDSIAIFSVNAQNGTLTLLANQPTGGSWPRNFSIDPEGGILLVANQMSGNVVSFRVDQASGLLTELITTAVEGAPAFVGIVPQLN